MLKRELKQELKDKSTILIMLGILLMYILTFAIIKNELYFNIINYVPTYLRYYVSEYLMGNASDLINNNMIYLYIENDLQNVMSAFFTYAATFGVNFCNILTFAIPFVIFVKINKTIFSEVNNKYSICKIIRIDKKKYYRNLILKNGLISGLIIIIPRILYLILLMIFFPTGVSRTHVLDHSYLSFMTQTYSYVGYIYSPYLMIFLDFLVAFIYDFSVSSLSIVISSTIKNKPLSYLIFIFTLGVLFVLPEITFNHVPYLYYNSIYSYGNSLDSFDFNIYYSLINITIFNTIISFLAKIIYKRGVEKNI